MDDDDERVDLDTVDEEIRLKIGEVMDENARIMKLCRAKANKCFAQASRAEEMAEQYREIGSLYVLAAKEHARMMADTIDAEYNIDEDDDEELEEEGEDEDTQDS